MDYTQVPRSLIYKDRTDLKDYIEKHPELDYIVSCAYDRL